MPGNEAVQALGRLADGLATGAWRPGVQLDLLEAMQATKAAPLQQRLDQLKVGRDLANLGDGVSGRADDRRLAGARPSNCRCSTPRRSADAATPSATARPRSGRDLAGVGSRLTRQQLLESLIAPSARLAPGFGQVSVTLKNGQKVEGTLREESATTIAIEDRRGDCSGSRSPTSRRAPTASRRCRR